jgi:putative transposase
VRKTEKAYRFRLYPTPEQEILVHKTFGCCRFLYNRFLHIRKQAWQDEHATMNYNSCSAELTKLKRVPEFVWLNEVDSTALQSSLIDLDQAFQN